MIRFRESIKFKLLITALIVSFFGLLLLMSVSHFLIRPAFTDLEHKKARVELSIIQKTVENVILHINVLCHDWGAWDDTYNFIIDLNQEYIDSNLETESFATTGMNLIYYYDAKGKLVFGKCYETQSRAELDLAELSGDPEFMPGTLFPADADKDELVYNFVRITEENYLITVSCPVLPSDSEGECRGTIIMGRFIEEDLFDEIRESVGTDFTAELLASDDDSGSDYVVIPDNNGRIFKTYNYKFAMIEGRQTISTIIYDNNSQPVFKINCAVDGEIVNLGVSAVKYLFCAITVSFLLLFIVMTVLTRKIVLQPLNRMVQEIESIQLSEDLSIQESSQRKDELGYLAIQFNNLLNNIQTKSRQLEILATTDSMTGILNHKTILDKLEIEISRAVRYQHNLSVAVIDIDYFKQINDRFGHQSGDEVIVTVVNTIKGIIRESDLFGRYGGDEFLLIFIDQDKEKAKLAMERIYQALKAVRWKCDSMKVTLSSGVAQLTSENAGVSLIIEAADNCLYKAKENGRNNYVVI